MSPSYEIMTLTETPRVNYAPEPCELVLWSLLVAKTHTTVPLCLDSTWRVLLPFFYIVMRKIRVVPRIATGHGEKKIRYRYRYNKQRLSEMQGPVVILRGKRAFSVKYRSLCNKTAAIVSPPASQVNVLKFLIARCQWFKDLKRTPGILHLMLRLRMKQPVRTWHFFRQAFL